MILQSKKHIQTGLIALSTALALAACGGGGGTAGSGGDTPVAEAPSDTALGSISGFGSIIVNGVRYDDSSASVFDDNGGLRNSSALALGMMVEVKGRQNNDGTGIAEQINAFSEILGPIANLNATAGTFTVLGVNVKVDSATVYQDVVGLSALANGNTVEVYGLRAGDAVTASRIERKTPAAGDVVAKIRGQISNLNAAASTFSIGTLVVAFNAAQVTPNLAALSNGAFVKVSSTTAVTGNNLTASRVQAQGANRFEFGNGAKSEIQGLVSNYVSVSNFNVAGLSINASNAVFVRGAASAISNGARLEIKGTVTNGTMMARLVKFEDQSNADNFELHGAVSAFTSLSSFVVRGVTVDASASSVLFERGTAAQIANGRLLEVEGFMQSTATGSILKATKVNFEDVSGNGSGGSSVGSANSGEFEFTARVGRVSGNIIVVGTRTVTISNATVFRKISQAQVVEGVLLEVKGNLLADGSVQAERISLED
jgi:Domain of unknown function (DUF5666)